MEDRVREAISLYLDVLRDRGETLEPGAFVGETKLTVDEYLGLRRSLARARGGGHQG